MYFLNECGRAMKLCNQHYSRSSGQKLLMQRYKYSIYPLNLAWSNDAYRSCKYYLPELGWV